MKVPQELRQDKNFDANYCTLVKALVPTRSRNKKKSETAAVTTPTTAAPIPPGTPPKKPKRLHKNIASRVRADTRVRGRGLLRIIIPIVCYHAIV